MSPRFLLRLHHQLQHAFIVFGRVRVQTRDLVGVDVEAVHQVVEVLIDGFVGRNEGHEVFHLASGPGGGAQVVIVQGLSGLLVVLLVLALQLDELGLGEGGIIVLGLEVAQDVVEAEEEKEACPSDLRYRYEVRCPRICPF